MPIAKNFRILIIYNYITLINILITKQRVYYLIRFYRRPRNLYFIKSKQAKKKHKNNNIAIITNNKNIHYCHHALKTPNFSSPPSFL